MQKSGAGLPDHPFMTRRQKKTLVRIAAGAALLIAALLIPARGLWRLPLFLAPYAVIGYDVLWRALRNILHGRVFDEQFLMAIATVGAFAIGEYPEAVAVMLFYQTGELFQGVAVGKSRRSIAALMEIRPDSATVLRGGEPLTVAPEEVQPGETILVRPGERIPLDGTVAEGDTTVNTAALTGEALPQEKHPGDPVFSGSVNQEGMIRVTVRSAYAESTVARVLALVENASSKKARAENFITRFARWYTPLVVAGALLLAFIPPLFIGQWSEWIHRALIFLVVSCPCALVISVPLTFFGGIGGASRSGILIKGANYMEVLARLHTLVLDKTGTLTEGSFEVTEVCPRRGTAGALLELAALAESRSRHPVAVSILHAYGKPVSGAGIKSMEELPGHGVRAVIGGNTVLAGNEKLMRRFGVEPPQQAHAGTAVHLAQNGAYLGCIVIADRIKPEAAAAIRALKNAGVCRCVMLTGDREEVARDVAGRLGLDGYCAELLPDQKVEQVEQLLAALPQGGRLGFAGDGINDAPVLSRADVGIAMGALGSDAAIEAADVVLMDDRLSGLAAAVRIARKTMRIVRENIVFALGVKVLVLVFGALGLAGMWFAVFADVGVMILAILNAMRSLKKTK